MQYTNIFFLTNERLEVENYRRQPKSTSETDQSQDLIQHAENEIIISSSGKINRYVTVGLELLEVSTFFMRSHGNCFHIQHIFTWCARNTNQSWLWEAEKRSA